MYDNGVQERCPTQLSSSTRRTAPPLGLNYCIFFSPGYIDVRSIIPVCATLPAPRFALFPIRVVILIYHVKKKEFKRRSVVSLKRDEIMIVFRLGLARLTLLILLIPPQRHCLRMDHGDTNIYLCTCALFLNTDRLICGP